GAERSRARRKRLPGQPQSRAGDPPDREPDRPLAPPPMEEAARSAADPGRPDRTAGARQRVRRNKGFIKRLGPVTISRKLHLLCNEPRGESARTNGRRHRATSAAAWNFVAAAV